MQVLQSLYPFIVSLHIVLSLVLILIIILQPGKGGDVGAAFGGGGGSTMFGPRGPANLLSRLTTVSAVLFMVTSITLALYSSQKVAGSGGIAAMMEAEQEVMYTESVPVDQQD